MIFSFDHHFKLIKKTARNICDYKVASHEFSLDEADLQNDDDMLVYTHFWALYVCKAYYELKRVILFQGLAHLAISHMYVQLRSTSSLKTIKK